MPFDGGRLKLICIAFVTRKLKSYLKNFNLRVTIYAFAYYFLKIN